MGQKRIEQGDGLKWLREQGSFAGCSFVTSLPDFTEFPSLSLAQWKDWFRESAALVLSRCPPEGVVIFYQRDAKFEGEWVDKSFLCSQAAEREGRGLLWRKVVCRVPTGQITFGKPGYSHLLCFSAGLKHEPGESSSPDVIPAAGKVTWARGMGVGACEIACQFILKHTETRTVVDPFCGHGSVLAVANSMGLDAVGVELSRKRAEKARALTYSKRAGLKGWGSV